MHFLKKFLIWFKHASAGISVTAESFEFAIHDNNTDTFEIIDTTYSSSKHYTTHMQIYI